MDDFKITRKEKESIRRYYPYYILKFSSDGSLMAKKDRSGAWGILYTSDGLRSHVEYLRNNKELIK